MSENKYGQVITFYSYKGGTGRTMALANVACLVARDQSIEKGVLMIDWDLEAPGLHRFFYPKGRDKGSGQVNSSFEEAPGLIDLFYEFNNLDAEKFDLVSNPEKYFKKILGKIDIDRYIQKTDIPKIFLMKAGKFGPDYPVRVNTFRWDNFYEKFPWLFRALAEGLAERFDYILIDSRTGITDTSGICTMIMPEKLVVVFVPNQQSLTGVSDMVKRAVEYRKSSDDLRPLIVFPLPSRIEANQPDLREQWRRGDEIENLLGYQPVFERLFSDVYGIDANDLEYYFDNAQIQHIPYYAYGEKIAVQMERSEDSLSIAKSYVSFTDKLISSRAPWLKVEINETEISDNRSLILGNSNTIITTNIRQHPENFPATAPSPLSYFVGRQKIRQDIRDIVTKTSQSIAILGMGGIGKTALAKQIAYDLKDAFGGNIFWADLNESEGDANQILRIWGRYCGREFPVHINGEELAGQVRGLLQERRKNTGPMFVVIDDVRLEWLDAGILLRKTIPEGISILITSRWAKVAQTLGDTICTLDELSDFDACDVLITRSQNELNNDQATVIARLCNNMPLALELAAQVAREEGVKYLLNKFADAAGRLNVLEFDDPSRKGESVRITFEISYNSLPKDTALIFRYLGAFAPIAIAPAHLYRVITQIAKDKIDADVELRRLRQYSLLEQSIHGSYHMHPLLYGYVQTILMGTEEKEVRRSHFAFFQELAKTYINADLSKRNDGYTQEFELFYPQLKQALVNFQKSYSLTGNRTGVTQFHQMIQLVDVLDKYWGFHSDFNDQTKWLAVAYEIARKIKSNLKQADFARRIGRVLSMKGQLDEALQWMGHCETAISNNADPKANAIHALMYIHRASINYQQGNLEMAEKDCTRGISLVDKKHELKIYAEGYNLFGVIQIVNGKLSSGLEAFEKSLSAWKQVGDQYQIARVVDNISSVHYYQGHFADAREAGEKSLEYWEQHPERIELAMALTNLGLVHQCLGAYELAFSLHSRAIEISDRIGVPRIQAITRNNIAGLCISLEKYAEAKTYLNESLNIQAEHKIEEYQVATQSLLAEVAYGSKLYDHAIELAQKAIELAREDPDPLGEGEAFRVIGQAYYSTGNLKQARKYLEASLSQLRDNEYKYESYLTLQVLKKLYIALGDAEKERETADEVQTLAKEMGPLILGQTDDFARSDGFSGKRSQNI